MIHLELTEYEAKCAIAHLTHRKNDLTKGLQLIGHVLSKRDQLKVRGDI